jgi:predicted dehydrogenase
LKIGIIGLGHLGKIHLSQWLTIEGVEVVGIFDQNSDVATEIANTLQIKSFTDVDTLIQEADALDIVTPTTFHYFYAEKCIKLFKHVFIEKPITETIEDANELVRLSKEAKVIAQVGHVERFNPAFLAIKNQKLNPHFIEVHRLAPFNPRGNEVPVVLDLMIHDIDIILSLIHSDIKRISANGVGIINQTVDIANARIEFVNGAAANLTASRISMKKMRKMRIFEPNKYLTVDFLEKKTEIYTIECENLESHEGLEFEDYNHQSKKLVFQTPEIIDLNAIREELYQFSQCIKTNTPPPVTLVDGQRALQVAIDIVKKIEQFN